jgi:hypothetical protein
MTSFQTYLLGFFVLVIGLAGAAHLLDVPTEWIVVGVIVLIGIGILAASNRKPPEPPRSPHNDPNRTPYDGTRGSTYDDSTRPY